MFAAGSFSEFSLTVKKFAFYCFHGFQNCLAQCMVINGVLSTQNQDLNVKQNLFHYYHLKYIRPKYCGLQTFRVKGGIIMMLILCNMFFILFLYVHLQTSTWIYVKKATITLRLLTSTQTFPLNVAGVGQNNVI